ncbi:hypothetical protein [uncultured Microscilla sp.]|uniref:hypothetical protein n=1 Tax=uncultured Microscilla sp. TaxID=432653 RepID=UPI00262E8968|nr:hypothetical protein [uncultured Microscilla sp.]
MINWKTIVGALLILGTCSELSNIISDYRSGSLEYWPFGVGIGAALVIFGGGWLIKSGLKNKT